MCQYCARNTTIHSTIFIELQVPLKALWIKPMNSQFFTGLAF